MNIIHKQENQWSGKIIATVPAVKRTIFYHDHGYFLSFPSMAFMAVFDEPIFEKRSHPLRFQYLSVAFVPELNGDQTKLYLPPLPNMSLCGSVCLDKDFVSPNSEELFKNVMNYFWSSSFKFSGLNAARDSYFHSNIFSALRKWSSYTNSHPNWIPQPDQLHRLGYPGANQSDVTLADWKK